MIYKSLFVNDKILPTKYKIRKNIFKIWFFDSIIGYIFCQKKKLEQDEDLKNNKNI